MIREQQKYDPWEIQQEITDSKVVLHCCRYWMLSEWECRNMSFPFWRLYHSRTGGSFVRFEGSMVELSAEKLILIPPYTSFSSSIKGSFEELNESIKGVKILSEDQISLYRQAGLCDQFFAHFSLGYPYDTMKAGVYEITLNEYWNQEVMKIESNRLAEPNYIGFLANAGISGLILYALLGLPADLWRFPVVDKRMLNVIKHIDKNLTGELNNKELSEIANLATNSFARLFKETMLCSVQQYIRQRRIDQAVMLLHHSDIPIEEIATTCGFCDRHHFSKVFKTQTGVSPASYRNKMKVDVF